MKIAVLRNILFWLGTLLTILLVTSLIIGAFREWWVVKMEQKISNYPWGNINESPWYYASPDHYARMMLIEGVVLTVAWMVLLAQIIRMKKTGMVYSIFLCLGLIVLMFVNGAIQ